MLLAPEAGPVRGRPAGRHTGLVRLVTFNIRHGASGRGTDVDLARLAVACAALRPDVLALQEVDLGNPRSWRADLTAVVAKATGMASVFGATLDRDGGQYGNALLVRGAIDDVAMLRLPRGRRAWERREPRGAIVATAVVGADRLAVAATHLSTRRGESGRQLDAVLDALARRPGPRALLGDLNRRPGELASITGRPGLVLADGPATFPAWRPMLRIDHVVVDGLDITDMEVVHTAISDHRALVVTVSVPAAPT